MRTSSTTHISLLLALIAGSVVTEAARDRITVRSFRTNYRIDRWDDGRAEPYRVLFTKFGLKSKYTFEESGSLKTLTVGDTQYTFSPSSEIGTASPEVKESSTRARMLLASVEDGDLEEEVHSDRRRLYDCADCEETWDNLCGVGIVDVCSWVPFLPNVFNEDAQSSLTIMCNALGAACETSAIDICEGQCIEGTAPESTPTPTAEPIEDPEPTPAPTDAETPGETGACNPNPCQNGGSCSIDPAGGHMCNCAPGFGGIACQTDTSSLDPFYIELDFIGTWTDARRAVFQSAADRWSEIITHVPCGGSSDNPAGRLLISSTLDEIDGVGGVLGSAGPTNVWGACLTVSFEGAMTFDIDDIADLENQGTFEGVILHEMGHVIGVGTLWGDGLGECTTCRNSGDPAWTCPAAVSAYADIGGSDADIVELDGSTGTSCGHLDEDIFDDELMTGFVDNVMFLSKMTASILDDLNYIVDPSVVDPYTLPSERGASINAELGPSIAINDTVVDTIILAVDGDGNVVDEIVGVMMEF